MIEGCELLVRLALAKFSVFTWSCRRFATGRPLLAHPLAYWGPMGTGPGGDLEAALLRDRLMGPVLLNGGNRYSSARRSERFRDRR